MAALAGERDYDPPEVTWPEPELEDGADPELSPPELELDPELLELPELPELELPELDEELPDLLLACWAEFACVLAELVPPGRVTATPAAAITPAAPAASVIVRSRDWFRSRAAIAAAGEPGLRGLGACAMVILRVVIR